MHLYIELFDLAVNGLSTELIFMFVVVEQDELNDTVTTSSGRHYIINNRAVDFYVLLKWEDCFTCTKRYFYSCLLYMFKNLRMDLSVVYAIIQTYMILRQ